MKLKVFMSGIKQLSISVHKLKKIKYDNKKNNDMYTV